MNEMINELRMAYGGNWWYLILLGFGIIFGLVFLRRWRKALIFPILIVSVVILNPVFYALWNKYIGRAYWRAVWTVPIVIIPALIPSTIVEKTKKDILKVISIAGWIVIACLCGSMIYQNAATTFTEAKNPDKLPDSVVKVADELLELNDEPYVITDYSLSVYLRQYSGRIHSLYGRDHPSIAPNAGLAVRSADTLENTDGDFVSLSQNMLNNDYKYLVTWNEDDERRERISDSGFELIKQVDGYGIYEPKGKKTETRAYNEYHQVTEVLLVDDNGELKECDEGYSIIRYTYSPHNTFSYRYYYNSLEQQLDMGSGYLHDLLMSMRNQIVTIFVSAKDDASTGMQSSVVEDFHTIGMKSDLMGKYRYSFFAVASPEKVIERLSESEVSNSGTIGDVDYSIISAGALSGNHSSIIIGGIEYSKDLRGLNIVIYDNDKESVIDSFNVDTFKENMPVYR